MTAPAQSAPPAPVVFALAHRELVRFFRQRNRVIGALLQPIIFWLLFSEGLRSNELGYAHFFPGTLAMILLFTAIFATISIIEDRNEGFLQGVLVAPVARWAMVLGKVLGGSAIALVQAVLFMILGWASLYSSGEVNPPAVDAVLAVVLMAVMAVALTSLGFFIAWRMNSSQAYHAIMSVVLFPMWLLSGAFFPQGSEGVLGWVVAINPLTYGVAGLRRHLLVADSVTQAWAPLPKVPSLAACWIVTALFAAVMLLACWKVASVRTKGDFVT